MSRCLPMAQKSMRRLLLRQCVLLPEIAPSQITSKKPLSLSHTHTHTNTHTHTHKHTHTPSHTHAHTISHTHTHTHKNTHTNTHTHTRTQTHAYKHTYKHMHTHANTHTQPHTHTHTHTHTDLLHRGDGEDWNGGFGLQHTNTETPINITLTVLISIVSSML